MNKNKISAGLIALGILGIISAILVDIVRTGALQIQAAQILIIELGLFTIILGLLIRQIFTNNSEGKYHYSRIIEWLKGLPMITWTLVGYFISYFAFFIIPMFFNSPPRIQYFNKYLPDGYPIGGDLSFLTQLIHQWFTTNQSPFYIQFYPPFTYIFLSPFLLINDHHLLFKLVTITTIVCFILSSLIIPLWISKQWNRSLIFIFFITGLFSYGMQFELERGQVNVFAFLFCMSAIYIYHYHHSFRYYAYLLFSIAIQLKIYPAIFIVMFIKDWRDWKGNLRKAIAIGLFNFSLLFIAGVQPFLEFIKSATIQLRTPGWSWTGNHSIKAFVSEFAENNGFGLVNVDTVELIQQHIGLISNIFMVAFILCFLSAIFHACRRNQQGFDTVLFLTCAIGALIIPVSNDYTLPILAAPMALALTAISNSNYGRNKFIAILLLIITSTAYSATLYPFKYKVLFLQNSFPALFIILITITILNYIIISSGKNTANNSGDYALNN